MTITKPTMATEKHTILIADNQFLTTEAVKYIIHNSADFSLAGVAMSVPELKKELESNSHIDLLITDHNLMDYSGYDELKKIRELYPNLHILILTNQVKANEVNEFSRIGIKNIIYKTTDADELILAIKYTIQGKKYYGDEVLDLLVESRSERDENITPSGLTPSEIEITKLIASGLTTKQIASKKHISFHTVMSHRKNIFRKLNINNTSELIMYAIKTGLIDNIEYYI
jgi:DNA-binding NarL/FixJ family response regulator